MRGQKVFVIGGGNSAGQAALHLAKWAEQVTILVRSQSLTDSMSDYLIREIDAAPNVEVRYGMQVTGGTGADHLESLVLEDISRPGRGASVPADGLFVLIGSEPRTEWLGESVARDRWGFILTGQDVPDDTDASWPGGRQPLPHETSLPGVFAAGDVRHGSVKRVASAVGEGAITIPLVHRYLEGIAVPRGRSEVTPVDNNTVLYAEPDRQRAGPGPRRSGGAPRGSCPQAAGTRNALAPVHRVGAGCCWPGSSCSCSPGKPATSLPSRSPTRWPRRSSAPLTGPRSRSRHSPGDRHCGPTRVSPCPP